MRESFKTFTRRDWYLFIPATIAYLIVCVSVSIIAAHHDFWLALATCALAWPSVLVMIGIWEYGAEGMWEQIRKWAEGE